MAPEAGGGLPGDERRSPASVGDGPERQPISRRSRRVPLVRFIGYYVLLVAIGIALGTLSSALRDTLVAPGAAGATAAGANLFSPEAAVGAEMARAPIPGPFGRAAATAIVILGALSLALPVAWVYMYTRRLRYDPSLVHSIIILPLAVSGIVIVVKNSLALAFSLAGIVAAVRFRNTLKDPKDAVYIFLAIGIGLSAGVQALDVALVISLCFSLVVLVLWKYNLGAIYTGAYSAAGSLGVGDPTLHQARSAKERQELCAAVADVAEDMDPDGIMLIHAVNPEAARRGIEVTLTGQAKEWRFTGSERQHDGVTTLELLVRLKKKTDPIELLAEFEDRWAAHIAAAEYVPFTIESLDS